MQVILLNDVPKVGRKYDVKNVSDGYAQNFLIPRRLAERATPARLEGIKQHKANIAVEHAMQQDLLKKNLAALAEQRIEMFVRANEKGHLYEGIHAEEIAAALAAQHIALDPEFLKLAQPIKEVGEHVIELQAQGLTSKLTLVVKAQ